MSTGYNYNFIYVYLQILALIGKKLTLKKHYLNSPLLIVQFEFGDSMCDLWLQITKSQKYVQLFS